MANDSSAPWGTSIANSGFTQLPNLLLDNQHALDMSSTELVVLLHLLRWTEPGEQSRPDIASIAQAMDLGPASVERCLLALEEMGLVKATGDGRYDLSRLVARLQKLAPTVN